MGSLARGASDMTAAEHHLRRAVDANPTDHKSRNRLARHLLECGRFDEARAEMLETRRLAPDDPDVQNIWLDYALRTGDYEGAIRQGEIWLTIWGGQIRGASLLGVREALGLAYVGARRYEDALAQFRVLDPDDELRPALVWGYAGRDAEARAILAAHETSAEAEADPGRSGAMAMAYVVLGDFDRALEHLDRQLAAGWHPSWLHCALFSPLRGDPRWPEIARRLQSDYFAGREHAASPAIEAVRQMWPRPKLARTADRATTRTSAAAGGRRRRRRGRNRARTPSGRRAPAFRGTGRTARGACRSPR